MNQLDLMRSYLTESLVTASGSSGLVAGVAVPDHKIMDVPLTEKNLTSSTSCEDVQVCYIMMIQIINQMFNNNICI